LTEVVKIINRAKQGMTEPFYCLGDDGYHYYVKGEGAGNYSLPNELLAGFLALDFELPIAEFKILHVPDELVLYSAMSDIYQLGSGKVFGSRVSDGALAELSYPQKAMIDIDLKRRLILFDWWIKNDDRTLDQKVGGNPNLLWNCTSDNLIIIDHNNAFDMNFKHHLFWESHVFSEDFIGATLFDLVFVAEMRKIMDTSLNRLSEYIDRIPFTWFKDDDDLDAYEDRVRNILKKYESSAFWSLGNDE